VRVIVWSINYAPEETGIAPCNTALCEYLVARGHEVEMVTTFPYYPAWRKAAEDCGRIFRTDRMNGVTVRRCWHYVPRRVTALKRMLHEGTFVVLSALRMIALPRADVIVVVSPPLLLGLFAALVGAIKRSPFLFHIQDLQPDAALGLGMLKPGLVARALYALETVAYRTAAVVSGITGSMIDAFATKGVPVERRAYLPNSVSLCDEKEDRSHECLRQTLGLAADSFIALYSGNLGVKQGLATLVQAAPLSTGSSIQLVICGDGAERHALRETVERERFTNVHLLPLQPKARYEAMLASADLCVITQQKGTGKLFFPSKLLTTLAHGKPVLAVADADSDLATAVAEARCGYVVPTGDPLAIATALRSAESMRDQLPKMGEAGRTWVAQFESGRTMARFEEVLIGIAARASGEAVRGWRGVFSQARKG
jgi:colanic acid biosynthesis glycosyl transferase WcaI